MSNTKIHLMFADGQKREYTVTDDIEHKIINGEPFTIETLHPKYGEVCHVKIGENQSLEDRQEIKEYYFLWCATCNKWCKIAKNKGFHWKTFNPEWISDFFMSHAGHNLKVQNSNTGAT
ncbi:hypothetical protein LCGC14_2626200 [marine sediment metagenome]|uniref:Uncharacterized protein n=1 Tax=marine sediment metagenome TaxID=412755 RepID=A0A0F9CU45_9ZZZZ